MLLELPREVVEILKRLALKKGKPIEELILDAVARELDPRLRIEVYLKLFEKYLADAEELYRKGDLAQAGEKYWGAVTALLSAIAEKRGLPHYTHRDFWEVVEVIVEETRNPDYSTLFSLAEKLHANFYHSFLRKESFDKHREGVLKLVDMLRKLVENQR